MGASTEAAAPGPRRGRREAQRVLLLNPPGRFAYTRDYFCSKVAKTRYAEHPVDLLVLSGILAQRHELGLVDAIAAGLDAREAREAVLRFAPDAVVFLAGTASWTEDQPFLAGLHDALPGARMIGIGDLLRDPEVVRRHAWIDAVLLDFTTEDVLRCLEGRPEAARAVIYRDGDRLVERAGAAAGSFSIPVPRHELFLGGRYTFPFARHLPYATVLTDFGCPHGCSYCVYGTLGYKERPVENVLAELEAVAALGVRELFVKDQSFGERRARALELCRAMARGRRFSWSCFLRADRADEELLAALREAGCHTVMIGIESASDEILAKYKPGITTGAIRRAFARCRRAGLRTVGLCMLGFPEDTEESCRRTVRFAIELGCTYASFNLFVPKPATPVGRRLPAGGTEPEEGRTLDQSGIAGVRASGALSAEQLRRVRRNALRSFYLRPSYLISRVLGVRTAAELRMLVASALSLARGNPPAQRRVG